MESVQRKKTARGVRLVQHGTVLSEVLRQPGPTQSVFDALAVGLQVLAPAREVALLGFAAGGMIGPLRAMGGTHLLHGVDLASGGHELFQSLCGDWAGAVEFTCEDALGWLKRQTRKFPVIVDDLSVPMNGDVFKPEISLGPLPSLMHKRLRKDGLIVANLLPQADKTWAELRDPFIGDLPRAHEVRFDDFENHILFAGSYGHSGAELSREIRRVLSDIGSELATAIKVVTLR